MEDVSKNWTPVEVGILFETLSIFSLFFHLVPGGHHGKRRRNSNHGVTLVLLKPSFFLLFFPWCSVATIGKREENLTMVLHSLQPLAIGFTTPCTLLPCTGPYFAKCPSIASSFSLEGQNIVRSFLSEGHVDLFFI